MSQCLLFIFLLSSMCLNVNPQSKNKMRKIKKKTGVWSKYITKEKLNRNWKLILFFERCQLLLNSTNSTFCFIVDIKFGLSGHLIAKQQEIDN